MDDLEWRNPMKMDDLGGKPKFLETSPGINTLEIWIIGMPPKAPFWACHKKSAAF